MTENKFLNILIVMLIMFIVAVVYYWINQKPQGYFSFAISDAEIGKYSSYKECLEEERAYHKYKLLEDGFDYAESNCDWKE